MSQNNNKLLPGILLGFVIGAGGMWFMNRNMSEREIVKEEVTTEVAVDSLDTCLLTLSSLVFQASETLACPTMP